MKDIVKYTRIIGELMLLLVPRYVTDRVALTHNDGVWSVLCVEKYINDDRHMVDAYGTIKTFTWFGIAKGGTVKLEDGNRATGA